MKEKSVSNQAKEKPCFWTKNSGLPFTLSYSIILQFKTCVIFFLVYVNGCTIWGRIANKKREEFSYE